MLYPFKSFNPLVISPDGVTIKPRYLYEFVVKINSLLKEKTPSKKFSRFINDHTLWFIGINLHSIFLGVLR